MIDERDANPGEEGDALARRHESECDGFDSQPRNFFHEISLKVYCAAILFWKLCIVKVLVV